MAEYETELTPAGFDQTIKLLGGARVLRRQVHSPLEAHDLLKDGIPAEALHHLVSQLAAFNSDTQTFEETFGMSLRTYQRNKNDPHKSLNAEQSGKAWIIAEMVGRMIAIFGSLEEVETWLARPAMALEQRRPIELLSTSAGIKLVEDHLTRLEYGVYT